MELGRESRRRLGGPGRGPEARRARPRFGLGKRQIARHGSITSGRLEGGAPCCRRILLENPMLGGEILGGRQGLLSELEHQTRFISSCPVFLASCLTLPCFLAKGAACMGSLVGLVSRNGSAVHPLLFWTRCRPWRWILEVGASWSEQESVEMEISDGWGVSLVPAMSRRAPSTTRRRSKHGALSASQVQQKLFVLHRNPSCFNIPVFSFSRQPPRTSTIRRFVRITKHPNHHRPQCTTSNSAGEGGLDYPTLSGLSSPAPHPLLQLEPGRMQLLSGNLERLGGASRA